MPPNGGRAPRKTPLSHPSKVTRPSNPTENFANDAAMVCTHETTRTQVTYPDKVTRPSNPPDGCIHVCTKTKGGEAPQVQPPQIWYSLQSESHSPSQLVQFAVTLTVTVQQTARRCHTQQRYITAVPITHTAQGAGECQLPAHPLKYLPPQHGPGYNGPHWPQANAVDAAIAAEMQYPPNTQHTFDDI